MGGGRTVPVAGSSHSLPRGSHNPLIETTGRTDTDQCTTGLCRAARPPGDLVTSEQVTRSPVNQEAKSDSADVGGQRVAGVGAMIVGTVARAKIHLLGTVAGTSHRGYCTRVQ